MSNTFSQETAIRRVGGASIAKGHKTGGKNFKKGQSGNPAGRPPVPEDIQAARELNQIEFERIVNVFLNLTRHELRWKLRDSKATALELMIGRMIRAGTMSGDTKRIEFLLNRMSGKPRTMPPKEAEDTTRSFSDLVAKADAAKRGKQ